MALDAAALAGLEANPDIGHVVDAPHSAAPLVLCFAFVDWDRPARFDFARRLARLEATAQRPVNRILLRDPANLWYQHGIPGLGSDVAETTAALARLIDRIAPTALLAVGQSMGGYGAIHYGTLLGADRILAFGPLSYLRGEWARRDGDLRWLPVMERLERHPPPGGCDDLSALLHTRGARGVRATYGTAAAPPGEPENHDALHARRLAEAGVMVETIADAQHAVVQRLIETGELDTLLERHLLDGSAASGARRAMPPSPAVARTPAAITDGWRSWIAENLALGVAPDTLVDRLAEAGLPVASAQVEVDRAARSPYLAPARRLADRVAKRDWTLATQRRLRALAPAHDTPGMVPRRHRLPAETFLAEHYAASRPVVISGMMDDWPALGWTPEMLRSLIGDHSVEVQQGRAANPRYEREAGAHRHQMPFAEFLDRILATTGNDLYLTANNGTGNAAALAPLWRDVRPLPEYLAGPPASGGYFWIGPAGTVTPTHHDLTNNFMAQLVGRKRIHLVDALEAERMYNDLHVYSQVDLEAIDPDRFPLMRDVTVLRCDLAPGELLFLPVGWWHHVRALDFSVTLTFTNFVAPNDFHGSYRSYGAV